MDAVEAPRSREHPGCVLGIALGLLILGCAIAWILLPKAEPRDGALLLREFLGLESVPAAYQVVDAAKLTGGEEVVQLLSSAAPPERELAKPAPIEASPTPQGSPPARVDWSRIEPGASDQPPRTLLFVRYPKERGKREIQRLFSAVLQPGGLEELGPQGGRIVLQVGTLRWSDEDRAFVLEREFERGGTFRDMARVDLSAPELALIVKADWARSEPFSKARLEETLATLRKP
jgi:hypothetical protein